MFVNVVNPSGNKSCSHMARERLKRLPLVWGFHFRLYNPGRLSQSVCTVANFISNFLSNAAKFLFSCSVQRVMNTEQPDIWATKSLNSRIAKSVEREFLCAAGAFDSLHIQAEFYRTNIARSSCDAIRWPGFCKSCLPRESLVVEGSLIGLDALNRFRNLLSASQYATDKIRSRRRVLK